VIFRAWAVSGQALATTEGGRREEGTAVRFVGLADESGREEEEDEVVPARRSLSNASVTPCDVSPFAQALKYVSYLFHIRLLRIQFDDEDADERTMLWWVSKAVCSLYAVRLIRALP